LDRNLKQILGLAVIVLAVVVVPRGQSIQWDAVKRVSTGDGPIQTYKLESKLMGREMTFQVVSPPRAKRKPNYRGPDTIYPVLYLLHGLGGHYDNWSAKTRLSEYAAQFRRLVILPEGGDGWYTDSETVQNDRYESYIIRELIPATSGPGISKHRAIAGLSMGGYGAIKFGLKYPEMFSIVGSFSGALDAPLRTQKSVNLRPSIMSVFGPEDSKTRAENDIFAIIQDASPEKIKTFPFIYLDCGTEDPFFQINRDFVSLLLDKKVPHEYRELPGNHNWQYWDQQVQEFLRLADKVMRSR
jgi:putative tributyrin esterase